jgi:hypothetical protein
MDDVWDGVGYALLAWLEKARFDYGAKMYEGLMQ